MIPLDIMTDLGPAHRGHEPSEQPQNDRWLFSRPSMNLLGMLPGVYNKPTEPHDSSPSSNVVSNRLSHPIYVEPDRAQHSSDDLVSGNVTPISTPSAYTPEKITVKKQRSQRPKTTFTFAHPPPTARQKKLHLRPKVLLQLQKVSASCRPKPAYEVIPTTTFIPSLARNFAKVVKGREKLGSDDVVVVRAEEYRRHDDAESEDEDRWSGRDVYGVICAARKEDAVKAHIFMESGVAWEANTMKNGGYELVSTDEHGLQSKIRWIPKTSMASRRISQQYAQQQQQQPVASPAEDKRFNFTIINPDSRRHPIVASMTQSGFEIQDSYRIPSSNHGRSAVSSTPGSPKFGPIDAMSNADEDEPVGIQLPPIPTDQRLRDLILVSGIWVAFMENWSPAFRYQSDTASPCPVTPSGRHHSFTRSSSNGVESLSRQDSLSKPKLLRTASGLVHRHTLAAVPTIRTTSPVNTPSSPTGTKTRSRRSLSTSTMPALSPTVVTPIQEREPSPRRSTEPTSVPPFLLDTGLATTPVRQSIPPIIVAPATPETTTRSPMRDKSERSRKAYSAYYPGEAGQAGWGGASQEHQSADEKRGRRPISTFCARLKSRSVDGMREKRNQQQEEHHHSRPGMIRRVFKIFKKDKHAGLSLVDTHKK